MLFQPKTSEDILNGNSLIEPGIYDFKVVSAKEKISKKGKEMIELQIKIIDKKGNERTIFDYLMAEMPDKLWEFSICTGLMDRYNCGEMHSFNCLQKSGTLNLIIEKGKQNSMGDFYPDRNTVKNYIFDKQKIEFKIKRNPLDDDIPF